MTPAGKKIASMVTGRHASVAGFPETRYPRCTSYRRAARERRHRFMFTNRTTTRGGATPHPERIPELDVLRGIAITAVVGLHASWVFVMRAPMDRAVGHVIAELHMLTGFGVPLFVALSAAGLTIRYGEPHGWGRPQLRLLARRARRLLPAYVLWSVVSSLDHPALLWPPGRLLRLLTDGTADAQFYFIPLIFEMYLLWPLFQHLAAWLRRAVSPRARVFRSIALIVVSAAVSFAWWHASGTHPELRATPGLLGFWLLYAVLGLVAGTQMHRIFSFLQANRASSLILAAATGIGAVGMWLDFANTIGPPFSLVQRTIGVMVFRTSHAAYTYAAVALLLAIACRSTSARRWRHVAITIGRHGYGIYLIHLLVLHRVRSYVIHEPTPSDFETGIWIVKLVVLWTGTLGLSFALTTLAARSRWSAWSVGEH